MKTCPVTLTAKCNVVYQLSRRMGFVLFTDLVVRGYTTPHNVKLAVWWAVANR